MMQDAEKVRTAVIVRVMTRKGDVGRGESALVIKHTTTMGSGKAEG